jgi:S-adenosylmethionine:tRNA ribosyltransferase-isomerase
VTDVLRLPDSLALLEDYDFELPAVSIAQEALPERDQARLMVVEREAGAVLESGADHRVRDLPRWLRAGDLLVVNATRVVPAKLVGTKLSGGVAEALLLGPDPADPTLFRALLKCTGRVREGLGLVFGPPPGLNAKVASQHDRGEVSLRFAPGVDPYSAGQAPLPPYIRRSRADADPDRRRSDLDRYQTVYAREPGAIAAPTAGLHLTAELLERLEETGVERAEVVLHVGAGTFRPLDAEALESGRLHAEAYTLPAATAEAIERTRRAGGRVVAVGTTTTRVLESCVDDQGRLQPGQGETRLFLRPGGPPVRVVDALLTNFHLPRSSLLLLVAAFIGRQPLLAAYARAVQSGFRFYSYGDAMLIVPRPPQSGAPR